jgi:hypothetical protein
VDSDKTLAREFTADGERRQHRFDIEGTEAAADIAERNRRPPTSPRDSIPRWRPVCRRDVPADRLDVLNTTLDHFPAGAHAVRRRAAADGVLTNRDADSPYRDVPVHDQNVGACAHLDDPDAVVHVIGGIADEATSEDYEGFRRALEVGAIGWSVYDFDTLDPSAWLLRAVLRPAEELDAHAQHRQPSLFCAARRRPTLREAR